MIATAVETYEKTLAIAPENKIAKRRLKSLKKRLVEA